MFLRNALNYVSGEILTKGLHFLSILLFSYFLTPEEYGTVSIFLMLQPIFTILFGLNLPGFVRQNILKKEILNMQNRLLNLLKKVIGKMH